MGKYTDDIRQAIDRFWGDHHRAPTIRELMEITGCPSSSHVSKMLAQLEGVGAIEMDGARPIPVWVVEAINEVVGRKELDHGGS